MASHDPEHIPLELFEAWPVEPPPHDFADRVMAARQQRSWLRYGALAAVLLLAIGASLTLRGAEGSASVARDATDPVSVTMGSRVVAVAKPGAQLQWKLGALGSGVITQNDGEVFYRVEQGGALHVKTPQGEVEVMGTCFTVEVSDMPVKTLAAGAVLGAGLASAVWVTVYEGKVRVQSEAGAATLTPGQRAGLLPGQAPRAGASAEAGVNAASVAEMAAAAAQSPETQLAQAQAQVRLLQQQLEQRGDGPKKLLLKGPSGEAAGDGEEAHERHRVAAHPSPEELQKMADHCEIRVDMPGTFMDREVHPVGEKLSKEYGLVGSETDAVNEVFATAQKQMQEELRAVYVDLGGDPVSAKSMSPSAIMNDMHDKVPDDVETATRTAIAYERAGRAPTKAWSEGTTPGERAVRWQTTVGDRLEVMLAAKLGPDRAREVRDRNGGWVGSRMSRAGCDAK